MHPSPLAAVGVPPRGYAFHRLVGFAVVEGDPALADVGEPRAQLRGGDDTVAAAEHSLLLVLSTACGSCRVFTDWRWLGMIRVVLVDDQQLMRSGVSGGSSLSATTEAASTPIGAAAAS